MTLQNVVITLFNAKAGADRREVFFPTVITGVSYQSSRGSSSSKGVHTENMSYKLRIPVNTLVVEDKAYVDEKVFRAMIDEEAAKHWTLSNGDFVLLAAHMEDKPLTQQELNELSRSVMADMFCIEEYADNTIRGSEAVKHWRIGGA